MGEGVELFVGHHFVDLHLEDHDGFSDGLGLGCLCSGLGGFFFGLFLGLLLFLGGGVIVAEEIDIIAGFLFGSMGGGGCGSISVGPALESGGCESAEEEIPVVGVWVGIDIGQL